MRNKISRNPLTRNRARVGLVTTFFGLAVFILGAAPQWVGLDRSSVVGFVQISVFLIGLGFISLGGFISLDTLRRGKPRTISADIGLRLVSTGYVIAIFTGLADVFGFGSEHMPAVVPYFGFLQTLGVLFGEFLVGLGFLLTIPFSARKK